MVIKRRGSRKVFAKKQKEEYFRVNEKIIAPQVRLVGEGVTSGIYSRDEALLIAKQQELDLIEISSDGQYPVCKVMEFSKFTYERKKNQKAKERANKVEQKQIRIRAEIGDHDFNFKKRQAIEFLKKGASVRVQVFFRRLRDFYTHRKRGEERLKQLIQALEEQGGKKKHEIKLVGRQIFTIIDLVKQKK